MTDPLEPPAFDPGFIEDYFAEADEHIIAVRRGLLALEDTIGDEPSPAVLEELFRSFHSLKGISAMVELRDAELLAHLMESCLRVIREGEVVLTPVNFESLVGGANALEEVVVARRLSKPSPAIEERQRALQAFAPPKAPRPAAARGSTVPAGAATKTAGPTRRWKVTFVPTPQLVERGVKVDTIRARLLQIGQIASVAPKILATGGISFEFQLQADDDTQLAAWRDDGVTYEEVVAAPEASASSAPADGGIAGAGAMDRPRDIATSSAASSTSHFVRVDLARLDDLMRLVGDLVVTRARLDDTLQRVEAHVPSQDWRALQEHNAAIERQLRDLREGVMRVRLVPVGEIFRRMPFVVRDLARDHGKRVRLDLVGQTTEIDKFLIERMMDPVLHLVRNAISHGIEAPDARIAAGKPIEGTIRLAASTAGESIVIEIADDGAGVDVAAVAGRARANGTVIDGVPDARAVLDIICGSGFSTRDEADRASGRGVGMAVVRSTVQELGGSLELSSEPGRGTTFTITLPLTLAITDAIIVHVGPHTFAIPQSAVREVIEIDAAVLRTIERNELVTHRGGTLPVVRLARLFQLSSEPRARFHALVIGTGLAAIGLIVDRIVGQREIVVKTITDPLIRVPGISGATELGDGRLVLILDAASLGRGLRARPATAAIAAGASL